jgi:hypothetical protein
VAVDVAPKRRDAVDVGVALGVVQVRPVGVVDHQRRLAVAPARLPGERVPDVLAVGPDQLIGVRHLPAP